MEQYDFDDLIDSQHYSKSEIKTSTKKYVDYEKYKQLQAENAGLREEIEILKHNSTAQAYEKLQKENMQLMVDCLSDKCLKLTALRERLAKAEKLHEKELQRAIKAEGQDFLNAYDNAVLRERLTRCTQDNFELCQDSAILTERLARLVEAAESVKQYMLTGKWDAKCGHSPEFMLAQAIDAAESGKEESRG